MRYVAFLRGMNVGGHRLKNDELCGHFAAMGFDDVSAFLASGNVVFEAGGAGGADEVARRIEEGLGAALGYEVPTFLRSADEVRAIAGRAAFTAQEIAASSGKLQVALLAREPADRSRKTVLGLATAHDRLALDGRELFWLPRGSVLDTELDFRLIEDALGPMTVRTRRTVERLAAKYFGA